jgi:organic hydroperoxide reductase OsmC/OhrA
VSLAQCHLLWYLHLAAISGVVVTDYADEPLGRLSEGADGSGQFTDVLLRPTVTLAKAAMVAEAEATHDRVHATCFIARSVNFPVRHLPVTRVAS